MVTESRGEGVAGVVTGMRRPASWSLPGPPNLISCVSEFYSSLNLEEEGKDLSRRVEDAGGDRCVRLCVSGNYLENVEGIFGRGDSRGRRL